MASVNKVILVGYLGRDPETRYMASGEAVCTISIATSSTWKDQNGEKKEATEWHRVVFFGKLAEIADEYLKKGTQTYVEGKLRTRKWQDKDGNDKYTTEIVVDTMQMLGARNREEGDEKPTGAKRADTGRQSSAPARTPAKAGAGAFDDMEDDIPF